MRFGASTREYVLLHEGSDKPSGNGGSGKVVISYPDTYAIATSTTGTSSPGAGVSGNRVYIWDSAGSITF